MWSVLLTLLCARQASGSLPLDINPGDIRGVVEALGEAPPRKTEVRYEPAPRLPEDQAPTRNFYKGCQYNKPERRYIHYHCVDALPHLNGIPVNVTKLTLESSDERRMYNVTFRSFPDIEVIRVNEWTNLHVIERGTFADFPELIEITIQKAPSIHAIAQGVLENLPSLKTLRITHTGLLRVPAINTLRPLTFINLIDLESNRIELISKGSFQHVRAGNVILNHNHIERIENWAFNSSMIAYLSIRNNRKLQLIDEDGFTGLSNITALDLSETSITSLPTKGLENIEDLALRDVHTLLVFPSVYNFRYIKRADLTYPYHCCAFKFPETQNPVEHDRFTRSCSHDSRPPDQMGFVQFLQAHMWLVRQFSSWFAPKRPSNAGSSSSSSGSSPSHGRHHSSRIHRSHIMLTSSAHPSTSTGKSMDGGATDHLSAPNNIRHAHRHVHRRRKRNHHVGSLSGSTGAEISVLDPTLQHHYSGHVHSTEVPTFGKILGLVPIPKPDPNGGNWQAGFDLHDINSTKELELPSHIVDVHPSHKEDLGSFGPNIVKVNETTIKVFNCGPISLHSVTCSPAPDAFNPCEDVMGTRSLRVAVWFVVLPAVVGNLAVMIVLMSSRFRMTVSKFLMCNLAFADLCMGIYLLMIAVEDVSTVGSYFNHAIQWQHGAGCKIAGFLTVFASELSIYTLTTITLERWYAITYSIHLNRRLKLRTAAKIMAVGWAYAAIVASLPLLGVSGYTKTSICLPMENRDLMDLTYLGSLLSINGLAFVLICACYARMYISIAGQQMANYYNGRDTTVAKRMALLVFTDFACWAPIAFFGLTAVAGYPLIDMTNSKILLVFFYPLNSCANPFLYAILTRQYRRDLFILLARYGLCTQRASKYKDASSGLGHNPHAAAPGHIRRLIRFGAASSGSSAGNSTTTNDRRVGTHCCSGGACGIGGDASSASQGSTTASRQFSFTPNGNTTGSQPNGNGLRDREMSSASARSQGGPLSPGERARDCHNDLQGGVGGGPGCRGKAECRAGGHKGEVSHKERKKRRQPPPDLILPRHSHSGFLGSHNSNSSSISPPTNGLEMQYFCDTHI